MVEISGTTYCLYTARTCFSFVFHTTYISLTIVDRSFHPEKPWYKAEDKINFSNIIQKFCNTIVDGKVVSVGDFGLSPHLYHC